MTKYGSWAAGSVVIGNELLISGGNSSNRYEFISVENPPRKGGSNGFEINDSPQMFLGMEKPMNLGMHFFMHSMVQYDEKTVYIIGGEGSISNAPHQSEIDVKYQSIKVHFI